jgi:hypothetical protein
MNDILIYISRFTNLSDLLNLLSVCKLFKVNKYIYFDKKLFEYSGIHDKPEYFKKKIKLVHNVKKLDDWMINDNIIKIHFEDNFNIPNFFKEKNCGQQNL